MPKKTPWFPGHVKPVRPGVYERDWLLETPWFSLWDGEQWRVGAESPKEASSKQSCSTYTALHWRGLVKP